MSNKLVQIARRLLMLVPLAFGAALIAAMHLGSTRARALVPAGPSPLPSQGQISPAATVTPHVTVNGHTLKASSTGKADMTVTAPDGSKTHVEQNGGKTTVTTSGPSTSSRDKLKGSDQSSVSIQSNISGGSSQSVTHVWKFGTSGSRSTSSSTSTHVFSTGPSHVTITP